MKANEKAEQTNPAEGTGKTAMQMLIDWLYRQKAIVSIAGSQSEVDTYEGHISVATELLELERNQIIEAHIAGQKFASDNDNPDSEEFYNSTYK